MKIPFTTDQFLEVFRQYNQAIWPIPVLAYLLAAVALAAAIWPKLPSKIPALALSAFWIWTGGAYHIARFSQINPAAFLFGAAFLLQGVLLFWSGVVRHDLAFRFPPGMAGWLGALLILYASVIYPLLGYAFGHGYPGGPMLGVAPCPTAIFTFGLLLWSRKPVPRYLLLLPTLWGLLGFSAALQLGMTEDIGLLVAPTLAIPFLLSTSRPKGSAPEAAH